MKEKTLAFDLETTRLASEVEEEFAEVLDGASPWSRTDLFGFGVGVIVDIESGVAYRYLNAGAMLGHLREANSTVGYNTSAFDLGVLAAHGNVKEIRARHIDINILVRESLDKLPEARNGDRIKQGGLDGLARVNGLGGKTGEATAAPALLREGRVEEVLSYCEADVRLVAELYRITRERGTLYVDAHTKKDGQRVELGRIEIPVPVVVET